MSSFNQMAASLANVNLSVWNNPEESENSGKKVSRTETIRQLLKNSDHGMTAEEIVWDVEFPNFGLHLVWLLLKYDIKKGSVIFSNGRYSWNREYEGAEQTAIRAAKKLLLKHGYKVIDPKK